MINYFDGHILSIRFNYAIRIGQYIHVYHLEFITEFQEDKYDGPSPGHSISVMLGPLLSLLCRL